MNECWFCEKSYEDILDLIAHLREEHNQVANPTRVKL